MRLLKELLGHGLYDRWALLLLPKLGSIHSYKRSETYTRIQPDDLGEDGRLQEVVVESACQSFEVHQLPSDPVSPNRPAVMVERTPMPHVRRPLLARRRLAGLVREARGRDQGLLDDLVPS